MGVAVAVVAAAAADESRVIFRSCSLWTIVYLCCRIILLFICPNPKYTPRANKMDFVLRQRVDIFIMETLLFFLVVWTCFLALPRLPPASNGNTFKKIKLLLYSLRYEMNELKLLTRRPTNYKIDKNLKYKTYKHVVWIKYSSNEIILFSVFAARVKGRGHLWQSLKRFSMRWQFRLSIVLCCPV